jgi:hypothetical protein
MLDMKYLTPFPAVILNQVPTGLSLLGMFQHYKKNLSEHL